MIKKEKVKYICLSEKDKKDLREWNNRHKKRPKQKNKKPKRRVNPLKNKPYSEFLKSDYWKKVRERVLKRDGYMCAICRSKDNLQVHHETYKNHFKEHKHLEDLITLCAYCHKRHHFGEDLKHIVMEEI